MKNRFAVSLLSLTIAGAAVAADAPKFEIADVHVSPTARGFAQNFGGVLRAGKYVNRDATMLELIQAAWGVSADAISGGPGWIGSDVFDVIAKVPDGTTQAKANLMLQSLLEERFKLVIKNGVHPVPRFVLTVGKGGSKLKSASGSGDSTCQPVGGGGPPAPGTNPLVKAACRNLTSAQIAENLRQLAGGYLDHDVIDQTKLEGTYDFDLEWTPRGALAAAGSDGISVFDAVSKQLGLKLESQPMPVESLMIESVNRKPTENPTGVGTALALAAAKFEAATIKPADPNGRPFQGLLYTGGSQMRAGGTLKSMIALSMQISPNIANDTVFGLPKSAETQSWDITAKVPSTGEGAPNVVRGRPQPPPFSVGLEMLRGLLVDSFELKFHTENREVTVYALTLTGGKPKISPAAESDRAGCRPDPNAPKPYTNIQAMISCKSTTMKELAANLQQQAGAYIDHPVVDATGLEGEWNFLIGWTPRNLLQPQQPSNPNQPAGTIVDAPDPTGISVFDAVQKELGLKLVKEKRSIPVIVVDHVLEKPIE
jgi:uncharacterized protein (TIGR03435 family)